MYVQEPLVMQSGTNVPMFQRNVLPPTLGQISTLQDFPQTSYLHSHLYENLKYGNAVQKILAE